MLGRWRLYSVLFLYAFLFLFAFGCGDDDDPVIDASTSDTFDAGEVDGGVDDDAATDASIEPPQVNTAGGPVIGERGDGYAEFLGIPYAAPPVGDLRWRAPQAHPGWADPVVSEQPDRCRQEALGLGLGGSEDCLYINVHTPDPFPEDAPVLVWIHGGGFVFGEGVQIDNGTRGDQLARRGAVVVSMNYRLGAYGFLAHPALTDEDPTSGNYGFADQVAALEWVQANIEAFGGDPDNVTIFGESAGGQSVCFHLISPNSRGLFHKAVVQSGLCDRTVVTSEDAENYGIGFMEGLGCDESAGTTCMRALDAEAIDAMDPGAELFDTLNGERSWWPVIDGTILPNTFRAVVEADEHTKVPTLVGWNGDEGTLFVMLAEQAQERVMTAEDYDTLMPGLAEAYGVEVDALLAQYPMDAYDDPGAAIADAFGDAALACPSRRTAQMLAPTTPTWVYQFNFTDAPFQLSEDRELGAYHSGEIQYIFGHPTTIGQRIFRGEEAALNDTMADIWIRFAQTGDLSADWDVFDTDEPFMNFDIPTSAPSTRPDSDICAFFE